MSWFFDRNEIMPLALTTCSSPFSMRRPKCNEDYQYTQFSIVVPDCLKSAVVRACRYEPDLNSR